MILISVDLPAPFSPSSAWISPGWSASETSSSACVASNRLATPRISRIGVSRPSAMLMVLSAPAGCVDDGAQIGQCHRIPRRKTDRLDGFQAALSESWRGSPSVAAILKLSSPESLRRDRHFAIEALAFASVARFGSNIGAFSALSNISPYPLGSDRSGAPCGRSWPMIQFSKVDAFPISRPFVELRGQKLPAAAGAPRLRARPGSRTD